MRPPDISIELLDSPRQPLSSSFARALSPGEPFPGTLTPNLSSSPHRTIHSLHGSRHSHSGSELTLLEKPLPSPNRWGRASITVSRTKYQTRKFLREAWWVPPSGWRSTVLAGAGLATAILVINIVLTAWGFTKPLDPETQTRILWQGECQSTHNTFTFAHLAINVCSTLLLGTSNAAMQCLSAPTREAVDRAHSKGHWLDIGISGFRNWASMDRWRKWCWFLLLISTVPLHLLYNSAIFQTTTANEYFAVLASPDFLDRGLNTSLSQSHELDQDVLNNLATLAGDGKLKRLENQDCIGTYSQQLVNQFSNVLLVATEPTKEVVMQGYEHTPTPSSTSTGITGSDPTWICGEGDSSSATCDFDQMYAQAAQWAISDYNYTQVPIHHCLAQETTPQCTVQLIPEIMIVVVICNIIKVACFISATYARKFQPLITLGDALASFLQRPDPTTRDLGPLSASDVRDAEDRIRIDLIRRRKTEEVPLRLGPWRSERRRWFSGASRLRWGLTYLMLLALWILGCIFMGVAMGSGSNVSLAEQYKVGFGNISTKLILTLTSRLGVIGNILVANAPQLLLSLTYLSYNGLCTCILICDEFTRLCTRRAPLRVSTPKGMQRGTYFLSLPYRYSVPLLVLSGLLHWALSQSVFLAEVKAFAPNGDYDPGHSLSCLGYSTLGMMITLLIGAAVILAPLIFCWRHYRDGAPLLESNSLAMSAACHLEYKCNDGVLKYGTSDNRVGLSTRSVEPLVVGERYTPLEELDTEHYAIRSLRSFLPRRQKILLGATTCLSVVTFVVTFFACVRNTGWDLSGVQLVLMAIVLLPLTWLYIVIRWANSIYRWRKKHVIRRFAWDVVPAAIFLCVYIVAMGVIVRSMTHPPEESAVYSWYYEELSNSVKVHVAVQSLNVASWLAWTVAEVWVWFDQLQYSIAALPNMRARRLGGSSKVEA